MPPRTANHGGPFSASGLEQNSRRTNHHEGVLTMKRFRLDDFSSLSSKSARLFLGAAVAVSFAATTAFAQQTAEQACTGDVMRLCQEFVPDHGRIAACLSKHKRQLSPACHSVVSHPKSGKKQRNASR
jgi:Cysteine rich repeat